jgi:tRNA-2-methylthio-N6-dimethylallyladenosine synthase
MPDLVSEDEKTRRIVALQSLQRSIQTALHEQALGSTVGVLIDTASRRKDGEIAGRTSGNTVVNCPAPGGREPSAWIGRTLTVQIRRAGPYSLWGDVVSDVRAGAPC